MNRKKHTNDVPVYLFHQGNNAKAYEFLGAHRVDDGRVVFRVWAPNAVAVSVVGNFNGWNNDANRMYRLSDGSIWECFVENISQFDTYKFCITAKEFLKLTLTHFMQKHVPIRLQNFTISKAMSGKTQSG